jgi:hypothetical protein
MRHVSSSSRSSAWHHVQIVFLVTGVNRLVNLQGCLKVIFIFIYITHDAWVSGQVVLPNMAELILEVPIHAFGW